MAGAAARVSAGAGDRARGRARRVRARGAGAARGERSGSRRTVACSSRSAPARRRSRPPIRELPLVWLEFERGGDGVFVLSAAEIEEFLRAG